jgi:hypothetical protein
LNGYLSQMKSVDLRDMDRFRYDIFLLFFKYTFDIATFRDSIVYINNKNKRSEVNASAFRYAYNQTSSCVRGRGDSGMILLVNEKTTAIRA